MRPSPAAAAGATSTARHQKPMVVRPGEEGWRSPRDVQRRFRRRGALACVGMWFRAHCPDLLTVAPSAPYPLSPVLICSHRHGRRGRVVDRSHRPRYSFCCPATFQWKRRRLRVNRPQERQPLRQPHRKKCFFPRPRPPNQKLMSCILKCHAKSARTVPVPHPQAPGLPRRKLWLGAAETQMTHPGGKRFQDDKSRGASEGAFAGIMPHIESLPRLHMLGQKGGGECCTRSAVHPKTPDCCR